METQRAVCNECHKPLADGDEYYKTDGGKSERPSRFWHKACLDANLLPLPPLYRKLARNQMARTDGERWTRLR